MESKIPQHLRYVQELIDARGVSGVLRLISINLYDRIHASDFLRSIEGLTAASHWSRLAALVAHWAEEAAKLEPPQPIIDEPKKET